jgi:hypothetical protein
MHWCCWCMCSSGKGRGMAKPSARMRAQQNQHSVHGMARRLQERRHLALGVHPTLPRAPGQPTTRSYAVRMIP